MNTRKLLYSNASVSYPSVSMVSTGLGFFMGIGAMLCMSSFPQAGVFFIAVGFFHSAEFWITAKYNSSTLTMGSFLLTNGAPYLIALLISLLEMLIRWRLGWNYPPSKIPSAIGLSCVTAGQYIRSLAMIQAAESFHHLVQKEKRPSHRLITDGVYSWIRHPSYAAYYLWACGSQLMLGNLFSLSVCAVVLFLFFRGRVRMEEQSLICFFGKRYENYRATTPSGIPFIS